MSGFIICALKSLADKSISIGEGVQFHTVNKKEIDSIWRHVWFETLKSIHSRKINENGFSLLTSILRVSSPRSTKPSTNIIHCIICYNFSLFILSTLERL